MAKELIYSQDGDKVYGWQRDFASKEEFIAQVKCNYEDGDCDVTDVKIEPCISTEEGVKADHIIPLSLTDVVIENFYTATVESREEVETA